MLACGQASVVIRWSDQGGLCSMTRAGRANWASVTSSRAQETSMNVSPASSRWISPESGRNQRAERAAEGAAAVKVSLAVEEQSLAAREPPDSERACRHG